MQKFSLFIKATLLLVPLSVGANAGCDVCQSGNSVACHNETMFSVCINGAPTFDVISCPANFVCTGDATICYERPTAQASCSRTDFSPPAHANKCGICNEPTKVFSCINATTIAFCFGADEPDEHALALCPANTYCDLNNLEDFCTQMEPAEASCRIATEVQPPPSTEAPTTTTDAPTTTTDAPTTTTEAPTTTTETPTTTAPPTRTPNAICQEAQVAGSFPYDNDTICTGFILCYDSGNGWMALERTCAAGQYFDKNHKICGKEKPPYCI